MNKAKLFLARTFFKELLPVSTYGKDASGSSGGGTGRELASEFVKRVTYKESSDTELPCKSISPVSGEKIPCIRRVSGEPCR